MGWKSRAHCANVRPMSRLRLPSLLLLTVAACTPPAQTGSALRVAIELQAGIRSTCVALVVQGTDGAELAKSKGARTQGRMLVSAAVFRGEFPEKVKLQAIGFTDVDCTMPTAPAEQSELTEATFPSVGVTDVTLKLVRTASGMDVDNDRSPSDVDCDDHDPRRYPGAAEDCTDGKDNNCDPYTDCGDPQCPGKQCRQVGSACSVTTGRCAELTCGDGIDNDGDDRPDCLDDDCTGKTCRNNGTCSMGSCMNASSESGLCGDGLDNDNDSKRDCDDPDCEGGACNDGASCNVEETCQGGTCRGGHAIVCAAPTNLCVGSPGVCAEALDGGCTYPPLAADAGCDDGLLCTSDDTCDGDGGCTGTPLRCDQPPAGACWDQSGFCNEDAGCLYFIAVGRLSCTDNDGCTVNDACLADGGCLGTLLDCSTAIPPTECQVPTGVCSSGACTFMDRTGACTGGSCVGGVCVGSDDAGTDGGSGGSDAGVDGGAVDAGPVDAGSMDAGAQDAGPGFLLPSNVPLSVITAAPAYPHFNVTCSTLLSLNPLAFVPNFGCTAPALPQVTTVTQDGGPALSVIVVDRLTVASGATLTIVPGASGTSADRAPVIAVRGDATVNGSIEVSAMFSPTINSGPGGEGSWCPVPTLGAAQNNRSGGGQGGAFGDASGPGGRGADNGGTGAPALQANGDEFLAPLRGGCAGSRGGNSSNGRYGHAGGALQLWARGILSVGGSILANGGRGLNSAALISGGGGGGGGSGGAILLEATTLNIGSSAIIAANGGSGAQGTSYGWGADGRPGEAGTAQVNGGSGANVCGGPGGKGGARAGSATGGSNGDPPGSCTNLGGGGGGGGSVGRIRFNALNPCTIGSAAKVSPTSRSTLQACRF